MAGLKSLMVGFISLSLAFCSVATRAQAPASDVLLQFGAKGKLVLETQKYLHQLNYLLEAPTGYFGKMTMEALKSFQLEYGLTASGRLDNETYTKLKAEIAARNQVVEYEVKPGDTLLEIANTFNASPAVIMAKNNLPGNEITAGQKLLIPVGEDPGRNVTSRGKLSGIQAIPWSIVNQLWKNGEVAKITDVETGESFLAKRYYGHYHADVEPLTKEDTKVLLSMYGGHWSWSRRAVVVRIRNLYIAASINGMPHGGQSIFNNNFQGQFCAHFLGSRIHKDGVVDPEHLKMIEKAAGAQWPLGNGENGDGSEDDNNIK